jgi:hypothetical protein
VSRFPTSAMPASSASLLSWLQGVWVGQDADRLLEEHWSAARSNGLMGMFRMIESGRPKFFELMTIDVEHSELVFRVKHFAPGLVGWEEKAEAVEFSLVQLNDQRAVFLQQASADPTWMVYQREEDTLTVHFEGEQDGKPGSRFVFKHHTSAHASDLERCNENGRGRGQAAGPVRVDDACG